jgi:hypothetical protein
MTARAATLPAAQAFAVALPENITRIETQAALYGYGVALFGFLEVADEAEAVERAEGRAAFLLKSNTLPVQYLIFGNNILDAQKEG